MFYFAMSQDEFCLLKNAEKIAFFCESHEETQNSIYDKNVLMVKREFHSESIHTSDHIF